MNTEQQLLKVAQLAGSGKVSRLLHHPAKYLQAMWLLKVVYPLTHKGVLKTTPLFFGGTMTVLLPAATDIYLAGGKTHDSEIRLARYLVRNFKKGETFLDIGAHFGYFTLLAAHLAGDKGKVYSIEPAKGTFGLLKENTTGKKNITVLHKAVSDQNGAVSFYEFPVLYSEYNAMSIDQFRNEKWIAKHPPEQTTVEAITIDSLLKEYGFTPAIIKIDVEGAEIQAIAGGMETWKRAHAPQVILEYLLKEAGNSYAKASALLTECGYKMYMIDNDGMLVPVGNIPAHMQQHGMTSENVVFKKG